ncbi:hypothetical protein ACTXT7_010348 [Hymenolepis weldensis]
MNSSRSEVRISLFVPWIAALNNATDDELIDLAAILGFTGMMNQVQFHASIENRGQVGGGFRGVAKGEQLKIIPDEPPNMTDDSIQKLSADDASLTVLNLNNIKTMSAEVVSRLCTALGENTKLKELHMAATNLTSAMVEPMILALKVNHTLEVLNLESNFITGDMILKILDAISGNKSAVTDLRLSNQRQRVLGVQMEQEITQMVLQNPRLNNLGLDFDTPTARIQIREHLKKTVDANKRLARLNKGAEAECLFLAQVLRVCARTNMLCSDWSRSFPRDGFNWPSVCLGAVQKKYIYKITTYLNQFNTCTCPKKFILQFKWGANVGPSVFYFGLGDEKLLPAPILAKLNQCSCHSTHKVCTNGHRIRDHFIDDHIIRNAITAYNRSLSISQPFQDSIKKSVALRN